MIDKNAKEICKRLDNISKSVNNLCETLKEMQFAAESLAEARKRIAEEYGKSLAEKTSPINSK